MYVGRGMRHHSFGPSYDFRQLDPDQVAEFAEKQVASGRLCPTVRSPPRPSSWPTPPPALTAASSPIWTKLLNPAEKPNLQHAGTATHTSPVGARELFDPAILEKKQACLSGMPCFSLAECFLWNCFACFYANSPPLGVCFPD